MTLLTVTATGLSGGAALLSGVVVVMAAQGLPDQPLNGQTGRRGNRALCAAGRGRRPRGQTDAVVQFLLLPDCAAVGVAVGVSRAGSAVVLVGADWYSRMTGEPVQPEGGAS